MTMLVSTQWLADNLGAPDLIILDTSSHLPSAGRDAKAEFLDAHLPGARFLELASLFDAESDVPNALPSRAGFARRMADLGVKESDRVVLYDDSFIKTAARAWFICRYHGMQRIAVLDGGLGKWHKEGRPVESGEVSVEPTPFVASQGFGTVRSKADMLANCDHCGEQVADGRGPGHFTGDDPDPNPNVAAGHIPGARNVVFATMFNEDGTYKDEAGIRAAFAAGGIDLDKPVVTSCGGGVVASVLLFALHLIGKEDVALYDGSWSEWGSDPEMPKETGAAA